MIEGKEQIVSWTETISDMKEQIKQVIVGQDKVVEQLLWCIFAGGHALLEGIPGLGKTMLVRTIADTVDLSFSRIQFTPDLMPADITGTQVIQFGAQGETNYQFQAGPIFGHLVLADEINRATPKTQSALLEAMQEKTVTSGKETYTLPRPFFVLATQNPLENEGTYPLPEAQLDRFLMKIDVDFPKKEELIQIVQQTTGAKSSKANKVADGDKVTEIIEGVKHILVDDDVLAYAADVLMMTHPADPSALPSVKQYIRYGSGPRGLQAMIATAKVRALMAGRLQISYNDIHETAVPALRHRMFLNFEGQALQVTTDSIIHEILQEMESRR